FSSITYFYPYFSRFPFIFTLIHTQIHSFILDNSTFIPCLFTLNSLHHSQINHMYYLLFLFALLYSFYFILFFLAHNNKYSFFLCFSVSNLYGLSPCSKMITLHYLSSFEILTNFKYSLYQRSCLNNFLTPLFFSISNTMSPPSSYATLNGFLNFFTNSSSFLFCLSSRVSNCSETFLISISFTLSSKTFSYNVKCTGNRLLN